MKVLPYNLFFRNEGVQAADETNGRANQVWE